MMTTTGFTIVIPTAISEHVIKAFNPPETNPETEVAKKTAKEAIARLIKEAILRIDIQRSSEKVEEVSGIT